MSLPDYYDNSKGSIYKFALDQDLNAWEMDLVKRIVRCRKKGLFKQDLQKTKDLIDLYIAEYELYVNTPKKKEVYTDFDELFNFCFLNDCDISQIGNLFKIEAPPHLQGEKVNELLAFKKHFNLRIWFREN